MFKTLASEKHKRIVLSDQNSLIFEAAEDVITADSEDDDDIDLNDLDIVMEDDGDVIPQEAIDSLEEVIDSLAEDPNKDVANMTKEEIKKHVEKVDSPSIPELDE